MADRAHVETDKVLNELADKIRKVYKQAADEMQGTVKDYFESFKERDLAQKKLVEKGKLTERQYKLWRQAQIGRGERYKAMQAKLAQRMTDAKEVAIAYINDRTAEVYSLNHNYAAYTIENASNLADFTLFDEQTVKDIIVNEPALTPYYPAKKALKRGIDLQYGKEQITKHVTSGIMQGKSVTKIADELLKSMAMDSYAAAMRLARTTMGAAQNGGRQAAYDAAEAQGVVFKKQWIATHDFRTRYSHASIDNVIIANNAVFPNGCRFPNDPNGAPSEVYNCRCTMVALVDGANPSNRESYDEWLDRKINEQGAEAIKKKFAEKGNYNQLKKNAVLQETVLQNTATPDNIIYEPDVVIGKSVGAKYATQYVLLPNGEYAKLTEGTRITNVEIIAGKGRERKIDEIDGLLALYPETKEEEWTKRKGIGFIDYHEESYKTALHWYEEKSIGRVKFKVKADAAGNWFIDE